MFKSWVQNLSGPEALALVLVVAMIVGLASLGGLWVFFEIRKGVRIKWGRREMMKALREATEEDNGE